MIGDKVLHYKIIEKIGEGGMGEVYLAQDTKLDRQVALKFLPEALSRDFEARERLVREAKAASRLNHKNIVTIYAVERADNRDFIVMEYVEGQSLREWMDSESRSVEQILRIAMHLADGLSAAHEKHVVHRDIKPGNIIVAKNGQAKLMDFGLATWRGAQELTKAGSTVGTAGYMSPEQTQGRVADHRSDLFSLGVVLYEMFAGRKPFAGDHNAAIIYAIVNEDPEPLERYKANLPPGIQPIISKLLQKDPTTRYQSAADLIADLKREKRMFESSSVVTSESSIRPVEAQKSGRARWITLGIALAAVIVLLILRPWQVHVQPTMEAEAVQNRLAVMYFDNVADSDDPKRLGEIAANLLITDLSESDYVQVVSNQRLYDILKMIGYEGVKKVDQHVATQVARSANARWMLFGTILQTEPTIIISAQIVDVKTGDVVASQRITGNEGENIFPLVDRLTVAVKDDLSLPAESHSENDPQIADVTTHSPDAYREYVQGIEAAHKLYHTEAAEHFVKAIEYDSTFAMAYFWLTSVPPSKLPTDFIGHQREMIEKAVKYSDKATESDRHWILAYKASFDQDFVEARKQYEELLKIDPDNKIAWFDYSNLVSGVFNDYDAYLEALHKIIEIDSLYKLAYNELAYEYSRRGDHDKSLEAINKYIELAPNEANPYDTRGDLYGRRGDVDRAIQSYRKAVEIKPDYWPSVMKIGAYHMLKRDYGTAERQFRKLTSATDPYMRSNAPTIFAMLQWYQGRFDSAITLLDYGLRQDELEGQEYFMTGKLGMLSSIHRELGHLERAMSFAQEAVNKSEDLLTGDRNIAWLQLVESQIELNRIDEAEASVDSFAAIVSHGEQEPTSEMYWVMRSRLAEAHGNLGEAIRIQQRVVEQSPLFVSLYRMGKLQMHLGNTAEAVEHMQRALNHIDQTRGDPFSCVLVHYDLGRAYEKSGWNDHAIREYETFLDIWKDADDGIEQIEDARLRLTRLTRGS